MQRMRTLSQKRNECSETELNDRFKTVEMQVNYYAIFAYSTHCLNRIIVVVCFISVSSEFLFGRLHIDLINLFAFQQLN